MDPQKTSSFTFSYRFSRCLPSFWEPNSKLVGSSIHQGTVEGIRFAYLDEHPENEMMELLICYTDEKGTQRRVRVYGEKNGSRLEPLISFLGSLSKMGFRLGWQTGCLSYHGT